MPFPTPTIRVRLTGLLEFLFTRDTAVPPNITSCRIGIHDEDHRKEHQMRVNVYRGPGREKSKLILELVRQVEDGFSLTVTAPDPMAPGIIICPKSSGPFSNPGTNELGFDRIPDIEGGDFHNVALPHKFTKFVHFNNGVFYTRVVKPGWILRESDGKTTFQGMMGIEAGINIYLQDPAVATDSKAVLTYLNGWKELKRTTDVVYEIEILNDCPLHAAGLPGMFESDFKLYYDKLETPPPVQERFSVVFRDGATGGDISTDHPCGPIFGGKSS